MIDYAITLVKTEAEATVLKDSDLQYVHNQLCTEKRVRGWANKPGKTGLDRNFIEVPVNGGHKLVFFSSKQAIEVCRGDRTFAHLLWVKVAPIEEFAE